eukprot:gene11278-12580_t
MKKHYDTERKAINRQNRLKRKVTASLVQTLLRISDNNNGLEHKEENDDEHNEQHAVDNNNEDDDEEEVIAMNIEEEEEEEEEEEVEEDEGIGMMEHNNHDVDTASGEKQEDHNKCPQKNRAARSNKEKEEEQYCSSTTRLFEGSCHTLSDFANDFQYVLVSNKVNYTTRNQLSSLFAKFFQPENGPRPIKLPFIKRGGGYKFQSNLAHGAADTSSMAHYYQFGVCEDGCVVYEGPYKNCSVCPVCAKERWPQVKDVSRKVNKASIFYRSLITRIKALLKIRQPTFANILKDATRTKACHGDNFVSDLLHGSEPRRQLDDMHDKFLRKTLPASDVIEVSLLLGQFFDGAQIFKYTTSSFWPIVLTILNLPPNLRHSPDIGLFVCALNPTKKHKDKTAISNFLFRDWLIRELMFLYEGFTYRVDDRTYYIQARLVLHCLDTMALCPVIQCHGPQSLAGCALCRKSGTPSRSTSNGTTTARRRKKESIVLIGHRQYTPEDNVLRNYGQSSQPCPARFFDGAFTESDAEAYFKNAQGVIKPICVERKYHRSTTSFGDDNMQFIRKVCNEGAYYPFTERRLDVYRKRLLNRNLTAVNGQYGLWHFCKLPYADVERHLCWDPFHAIKGLIVHLVENLRGKRVTQYPIGMCKATRCHPSLYSCTEKKKKDTNKNSTWILTEGQQAHLDIWISALLIPTGSRNEFDLANMMSNFLMKPGITQMKFIACIFPAILLSITNVVILPQYFIGYIVCVSDIICKLISPVFDVDELDTLHKQVLEFISMHEGIFPPSESYFIIHELAEIPLFIRHFGPVRGWWTLFGERLLSTLKSFRAKGGRSYGKHIWQRYIEYDVSRLSNFLQNYVAVEENDIADYGGDDGDDDDNAEEIEEEEDIIAYEAIQFSYKLYKVLKMKDTILHLFEFRQLVIFLLSEVEDHFKDQAEALEHSFLYRAYWHFLHCKSHNRTNSLLPADFVEWIVSFNKYRGGDDGCEDYQHGMEEKRKHLLAGDDIPTLFDELLNLRVISFRNAVIGGIELRARGWECREKTPKKVHRYGMQSAGAYYKISNPLNRLRDHWSSKPCYSSWCKIETNVHKTHHDFGTFLSTQRGNIDDVWKKWTPNRQQLFAQVNAFMMIRLPSDKFLDRYPVVSLVCREAKKNNLQQKLFQCHYIPIEEEIRKKSTSKEGNKKLKSIEDTNMFYPFKLFANARDIVPTRVGCIGIDSCNAPVKAGHNYKNFVPRHGRTNRHQQVISRLLLIELDRYWTPIYEHLVKLPTEGIRFEDADDDNKFTLLTVMKK